MSDLEPKDSYPTNLGPEVFHWGFIVLLVLIVPALLIDWAVKHYKLTITGLVLVTLWFMFRRAIAG